MAGIKVSIDHNHLNQFGFSDLGIIDPQVSTYEIVNQIGRLAEMPGISPIQVLIPKSKEAGLKNNYSGNYGFGAFPLHTDFAYWHIPPRYFVLRAIIPAQEVLTTLMHTDYFIKKLGKLQLQRAIFKPRRKTSNQMFLLRGLESEIFRWDELYLTAENEEAERLSDAIKAVTQANCLSGFTLSRPGQCVLIDNWKVLHGRSSVPEGKKERVVERAYLSEII